MGQQIIQVDAFTDRPFAGNPAAVCILEQERDADWMQRVAMDMNLAETAFLMPRNGGADGYDLRWFTPLIEVDLCGHATLASAHVLWEEGHLPPAAIARFHTRSGLLTAERRGVLIELDFPAQPAAPVSPPPGLLESLGMTAGSDSAPSRFVGRNRMDYLIEARNEAEVRSLRPDFGRLRQIEARGFIVTSRSDDPRYAIVSRFFAPAVGIDEDPVTGSAHCCLAPYWSEKLSTTSLRACQASQRGGELQIRLEGNRVKLGGQAMTVLRGELTDAASGGR